MFKKLVGVGLSIALAGGVLAGCSTDSTTKEAGSSDKYVPTEKLTVQFVPSQNADSLEAKAKPLEELLTKELGVPVEVSVSTSFNTIVEAMDSKKVDVGFLPPTGYILAKQKGAAEVLLQSQRYGVNPEDGAPTEELVEFYEALIITKKDSPINSLEDLKGKKVAWQDVTSSAGYVWPAVELKKAGIDPKKDIQGTPVKGHDQALLAVLNGQVDAAAVFGDARNILKKDQANIFETTKVVHRSQPIPNDTISVRSDMSDEWKEKIKQAFINIGKDEEGHKIVKDIYSHEGYVASDDSTFDIVREYQEAVRSLK
ncbi:phosphate/phosphite/phosphonate ABC transporter substrate-binding protein [Hazenella sp. IB182357]|uniref:Phosphate/phosphite/phosphonate ABC transporter substrate-binding protein n=1 Tax=Polycladospora coralii TaxID=2771432 RepID=A0A926NDB5_9BACL|nr:phosphate/phosphite/phosphonate ABC transporter substrate-binding protein [Polycladospora coralii]MBD1371484.1 phosphate/phosphite/phosphonate ABC transporter substrate-binding protein [Polycladospora coralii]MBS7530452.1 phosphate/phosphite/phosphonate ABC transporter substrate-binding protein [Polycladospora coralii]